MSPDQPPYPDNSAASGPPDRCERTRHPEAGATPDGTGDGELGDAPTPTTEAPGRVRQGLSHARQWLLTVASRLVAWVSATAGARGAAKLHRVPPRMRVLQLGSATMAVGVLSVLVGGIDSAPQQPKVDLAAAKRPLTAAAPAHQAQPVRAWATQASDHTGVPPQALRAYAEAARALHEKYPGCQLPWNVLAGIGRVESNHARIGGSTVLDGGRPSDPIVGIALNGAGVQAISDTDDGELDGDPVHDRAVGPMQFIPSTWQTWATDGNGDGTTDPQNLYDAAATAGHYLCGTAQGGTLADEAGQRQALMTYNQSTTYGQKVLNYAEQYASVEAPPTRSS